MREIKNKKREKQKKKKKLKKNTHTTASMLSIFFSVCYVTYFFARWHFCNFTIYQFSIFYLSPVYLSQQPNKKTNKLQFICILRMKYCKYSSVATINHKICGTVLPYQAQPEKNKLNLIKK